MPKLKYEDQLLEVEAGKTVLDTLLGHGLAVPNSCRAGVCQACMLQATAGTPSAESQEGLKDTLVSQGYFLACQCRPEDDLEIRTPGNSLQVEATVTELNPLSKDVMELKLRPDTPIDYRAGQYMTLWRDERHGRSYSLASVHELDDSLHFHVKYLPNGLFSGWVHQDMQVGDRLSIQGPSGECFYTPGDQQRPLLLVGTGTGLAPLYGIIRDALNQGHQGPIHLLHGALNRDGLYLNRELLSLDASHENVHYGATILDASEPSPPHIHTGPIEELAMQSLPLTPELGIYLCGAPDFVNSLRKQLFLAGASLNNIHADAFLPSAPESAVA